MTPPVIAEAFEEKGEDKTPLNIDGLYFLFTFKIGKTNKKTKVVLMSDSGFKGTFKSVTETNKKFKKILDEYEYNKIEFFNNIGGSHRESMIDVKETHKISRDEIGYGIHPEIKNKYVNLGRYIFNYHSLYYKNYFKLYNKNHQSIASLPGLNVSDGFVNVIQKLISDKHVTKEDLDILSPNERHYYNTTMHV